MFSHNKKIVLLSIKPKYAEKIFLGQKKIELRRICPKVKEGDYIIIYVSSPVKSLVGKIQVKKIISESPQKLWKRVSSEAGITKQIFDQYYEGASLGYGIYVSRPEKLPNPIHLNVLRKKVKGFRPPQNYYYVSSELLTAMSTAF
ncbi:MAG TPA: ASCH domain-containing protein [Bacteroidota bacterium]|nr:ASCH domain-containing protein [Bacteroidota bacterium]